VRRLDEAAAAGQRVVVELQVRRFRCCEPACPKATFVEQVPGLTFRHGRRSQGLHATLQRVALMLADRAGSRPADALATPVSRSTLLRLIHAVPESAPVTPRVLGVDEFALRKGHVYATVLVDIETHRVVDLLPDRTVETVSAWLAAHPGVEVICRHRPASFGEAGRIGAPDASSPRRPAACGLRPGTEPDRSGPRNAMMPSSLALIREGFTDPVRRGRAIALWTGFGGRGGRAGRERRPCSGQLADDLRHQFPVGTAALFLLTRAARSPRRVVRHLWGGQSLYRTVPTEGARNQTTTPQRKVLLAAVVVLAQVVSAGTAWRDLAGRSDDQVRGRKNL
jgi:hypothetical protein